MPRSYRGGTGGVRGRGGTGQERRFPLPARIRPLPSGPEAAGPLHARAVAILEKAMGPGHPEVAMALRGLARCVEQGQVHPRLAIDPAIAALHGDPRFERLCAQVRPMAKAAGG